jgi:hypothetical protein
LNIHWLNERNYIWIKRFFCSINKITNATIFRIIEYF